MFKCVSNENLLFWWDVPSIYHQGAETRLRFKCLAPNMPLSGPKMKIARANQTKSLAGGFWLGIEEYGSHPQKLLSRENLEGSNENWDRFQRQKRGKVWLFTIQNVGVQYFSQQCRDPGPFELGNLGCIKSTLLEAMTVHCSYILRRPSHCFKNTAFWKAISKWSSEATSYCIYHHCSMISMASIHGFHPWLPSMASIHGFHPWRHLVLASPAMMFSRVVAKSRTEKQSTAVR